MKRFMLLFVVLVVVAMSFSAFAKYAGDWNTWQKVDVSGLPAYQPLKEAKIECPKATGKMVMDGQPTEADWKTAAVISLDENAVEDWQQFGTQVMAGSAPDDAKDLSAKFYFLYDSDNLYVFAVISDNKFVCSGAEKHKNDAIEFFFDPDNSRVAPNQKYFGAANLKDNSDAEFAETPGSTVKKGRWADGYTLEFNIVFNDIKAGLSPADGKTFGIDVQIDDADDPAIADRQKALVWCGGDNQDWLTSQYYGYIHCVK